MLRATSTTRRYRVRTGGGGTATPPPLVLGREDAREGAAAQAPPPPPHAASSALGRRRTSVGPIPTELMDERDPGCSVAAVGAGVTAVAAGGVAAPHPGIATLGLATGTVPTATSQPHFDFDCDADFGSFPADDSALPFPPRSCRCWRNHQHRRWPNHRCHRSRCCASAPRHRRTSPRLLPQPQGEPEEGPPFSCTTAIPAAASPPSALASPPLPPVASPLDTQVSPPSVLLPERPQSPPPQPQFFDCDSGLIGEGSSPEDQALPLPATRLPLFASPPSPPVAEPPLPPVAVLSFCTTPPSELEPPLAPATAGRGPRAYRRRARQRSRLQRHRRRRWRHRHCRR